MSEPENIKNLREKARISKLNFEGIKDDPELLRSYGIKAIHDGLEAIKICQTLLDYSNELRKALEKGSKDLYDEPAAWTTKCYIDNVGDELKAALVAADKIAERLIL